MDIFFVRCLKVAFGAYIGQVFDFYKTLWDKEM